MFGNLVVGLGLNSKKFNQGLDQSQSKLGSFAGFIRGGLAAAVVGFTALAASATVGAGLQMVTSAEQAEVAFTTMLGSAEQAKSLLGEIEAFAASTPFQLQGLKESAQQLLAFGFAGDSIMGHMKTLGDLAAGTQKPLADFVDIFGKVKATGVAALGDINRLADRGVPIYQALAETMGKPQSAIKTLASTGKIGLGEIQTALESVVQEGGLFENAMEKQSQTLGGIWSTLKDNALFVLGDISQAFVDGLDLKGSLTGTIDFVQSFREGLQSVLPFVQQYARNIKAYAGMLIEFAGLIKDSFVSAFSYLVGETGNSFADMTTAGVSFLVALEYGFTNWKDVAGLAITWVELKAVAFFGEVSHFFTGVLPAALNWFSDSWSSTFYTAFDLVSTIFIKIGQNIRTIMKSVWEYIASGGEKSLTLAWTPLTEGFHNSMKELKIPDRVKSDLEKQLENQFSSVKSEVGQGYQELLQERMQLFKPPEVGKTPEQGDRKKTSGGDEDGKKGKAGTSSFGAALKFSRDAVSSIIRNVNQGKQGVDEQILKAQKEQVKEQKKQTKATNELKEIMKQNQGDAAMVGMNF